MSTRSGKRIHASVDSSIVDTETVLQSERKTRSKKQKENVELSVKNRHNYVSYPADEADDAIVSSDATEAQVKVRRTGRVRRNTLKEHNAEEPVSINTELANGDKSVRKSRRLKKVIDEPENTSDIENIQHHEQSKPIAIDKKKSKKKKNHKNVSVEPVAVQEIENEIIEKKSIKKKKRKSNSFVISKQKNVEQNETDMFNRSIMSVDSFHSAAGSPVKVNNKDEMSIVQNEHEGNLYKTFIEKTDVPTDFNTTLVAAKKKERKSSIKNSTFDFIEAKNVNENNSYITFDNISEVIVTDFNTTADVPTNKRRKSSIKNSTFDKIITKDADEDNSNTTFDKLEEATIDFNTTIDVSIKKRRRSSIKNSTFDKIKTKVADVDNINTTFDKPEEAPTDFNTSVNVSTKKGRRSSIKNSTFDKIKTKYTDEDNSNTTFDKLEEVTIDFTTTVDVSTKKRRRSSIKNSTFDKIKDDADNDNMNTTFDKPEEAPTDFNTSVDVSTKNGKRSSIKNSTFDKIKTKVAEVDNINTTFDKPEEAPTDFNTSVNVSTKKGRRSSIKNTTFDKIITKDADEENINTTFDNTEVSTDFNTTVDVLTKKRSRSSIKNYTFDKIETSGTKARDNNNLNSTLNHTIATFSHSSGDLFKNKDKGNLEVRKLSNIDTDDNLNDSCGFLNTTKDKKRNQSQKCGVDKVEMDFETSPGTKEANVTFDKDDTYPKKTIFVKESLQTGQGITPRNAKSKSLDSTLDKCNRTELNTTFDTNKNPDRSGGSNKSSLISSDATINVTSDKSADNSRISVTSDESLTENILNHTPVLIESSIDESRIHEDKTPEKTTAPSTPLKRESTFTKDGSDCVSFPNPKSEEKTPAKRKSSPGHTPHPYSKSSHKEKSVMNVTHSIEKSFLIEAGPRQTRVMFCSPMNNSAMTSQRKGRVIKSNLKGSNKSFVFDDSGSPAARPGRRKRSLTLGDADTRVKRKRLADELQHSVDRLSRPRTVSAAGKLVEPGTPSKKPGTPSKARPESKVSRTKLPNFAALHQKQFAKMESLDECQERKAKRARQLLTPNGCIDMLERISPKGTPPKPAPPAKDPTKKLHTPSKPKPLTLQSLNPGYTRFGFKLKMDGNPFSVTVKTDAGKERPSGQLSRQTSGSTLPSLAGATANRRDVAKQTVMREKSFTEKRDVNRKETRTVIKGVRTNRRFELQMKLRNINS